MINLQTQHFGNNICHWTQKIIQKHLLNFKLSKTVGQSDLEHMRRSSDFWKNYKIWVFSTFLQTFWILFLHTEYPRYTREMIRMTYLIRGLDFRAWPEILKVSKFASKLERWGWSKPINQNCRLEFSYGNLLYFNPLTSAWQQHPGD